MGVGGVFQIGKSGMQAARAGVSRVTTDLGAALADESNTIYFDAQTTDRRVADVISADAVVVNDILAKHYGIPGVTGSHWRRVEKVGSLGRGGFLGFGAVIAKQSAAARTSPIKRGAWLLQLLGERLPGPHPDGYAGRQPERPHRTRPGRAYRP